MNRLSDSISVIDTKRRLAIHETSMTDPTPTHIREGRGYLFDARLSGNGTISCASCHVDADRDGLAWDLGDPSGRMFHLDNGKQLHPMKGPLLTQTLRGLAGEFEFHWRGDRPGLAAFNGTFVTLMGGNRLDDENMTAFAAYLRDIRFSGNPHRTLQDQLPYGPLGRSAADGENIFFTKADGGMENGDRKSTRLNSSHT